MPNDGWDPGPKYRFYLGRIQDVLAGSEKRTVRDVYYALEATGFPAECADRGWEFDYKYVKRAVKKGRRHGFIDPGKIYDASRDAEAVVSPGYSDPEQFLRDQIEGIWEYYDENFWAAQDAYVEVWLEKQSLASVFAPICEDLNVRLEATRGDWSDSKVYEAAQRLAGKVTDGDDVKILYFGDFNPSGFHAPVSIQETMSYYGVELKRQFDGGNYFEIWPFAGPTGFDGADGTIEFVRVAINLEHIKRYDLPENPSPSSTDKDRKLRDRFMRHVTEGRDVNIELNALKEYHRDDLEAAIRDSIEQYIDEDVREDVSGDVEEARRKIEEAIEIDYDGVGE